MPILWLCRALCFFKQKTAYEWRISDWSSDVCSSDLVAAAQPVPTGFGRTVIVGDGLFQLRGGDAACVGEGGDAVRRDDAAVRIIEARGLFPVEIGEDGRGHLANRLIVDDESAGLDRKSTRLNSSH